MSKRQYVKKVLKPEPEPISLEEFNRNLLHLVKTKPPKKDSGKDERKEK